MLIKTTFKMPDFHKEKDYVGISPNGKCTIYGENQTIEITNTNKEKTLWVAP